MVIAFLTFDLLVVAFMLVVGWLFVLLTEKKLPNRTPMSTFIFKIKYNPLFYKGYRAKIICFWA